MPSCLMCHRPTTGDGCSHLTVYGERAIADHQPVVVPAQHIHVSSEPSASHDWLADSWSDLFAAYDEVRAAVEGEHGTAGEIVRLARAQQDLVDAVVELVAKPDDPEYDPRVW